MSPSPSGRLAGPLVSASNWLSDDVLAVPRAGNISGPRPARPEHVDTIMDDLSEKTIPLLSHRARFIIVILGLTFLAIGAISSDAFVSPLQGRAAPELASTTWVNSNPLKLEDVRGKVVLLEFWTYG